MTNIQFDAFGLEALEPAVTAGRFNLHDVYVWRVTDLFYI